MYRASYSLVCILLGLIFLIPAHAGNGVINQASISEVDALGPVMDRYKLQFKKLEELEVPAKKYRQELKKLIAKFRKERIGSYQAVTLTQSGVCEVKARKPDPFKGRNQDQCQISFPSGGERGKWMYKRHTTSENSRLQGGSASYTASPSADEQSVSLFVACTSPYWDDSGSGHCGLKMSITTIFKLSESEILNYVNAEASQLISED